MQVEETAGANTWLVVGMYRPGKGRWQPTWLLLALSRALGILDAVGVEVGRLGS